MLRPFRRRGHCYATPSDPLNTILYPKCSLSFSRSPLAYFKLFPFPLLRPDTLSVRGLSSQPLSCGASLRSLTVSDAFPPASTMQIFPSLRSPQLASRLASLLRSASNSFLTHAREASFPLSILNLPLSSCQTHWQYSFLALPDGHFTSPFARRGPAVGSTSASHCALGPTRGSRQTPALRHGAYGTIHRPSHTVHVHADGSPPHSAWRWPLEAAVQQHGWRMSTMATERREPTAPSQGAHLTPTARLVQEDFRPTSFT